jgi:hypothetical protein
MTQIEAMNQLNEPDWQKEVALALVRVALPIAADATHAANAYAKQVINNTDAYVQRFQLMLLTELDLETTSLKQSEPDAVTRQVFDLHIDIPTQTTEDSIAKWFQAFA